MPAHPKSTLGIIAGNGRLPELLIEASQKQGKAVCVVTFDKEDRRFDHCENVTLTVLSVGQVGKAITFLKCHGVTELVFAGGLHRPKLSNVKTDIKGGILLSKLLLKKRLGDDSLLSTIVAYFEKEGFTVVGADSISENLVMPEGVLGTIQPTAKARRDVETGHCMAKAIGQLDIGQGVIVRDNHVLGVEAVEGTDRLIARCGSYGNAEGGVLVKVCKPSQDRRIDLPTLGVQTIISLAEHGFNGVAMEANHALILDKDAVIKEANKRGVFIIGV